MRDVSGYWMRFAGGVTLIVSAVAPSVSAQLTRPPTTAPTIASGPPPTGFQLTASTPASASFGWAPASGATGYTVLRTTGVGQPWTTLTPAPITALAYVDQNAVDHRVAYTYRLQAMYPTTPPGYADLAVTLPAPRDPTNFAARTNGGAIALSWTPASSVPAAMLYGPGLPAAGQRVTGGSFSATGLAGPNTYRIASLYEPGGVLTPSSSWPSTMAVIVPAPSVPWLSMPNGRGDIAVTLAYYKANWTDDSNCLVQVCILGLLLNSFGIPTPGSSPPANPVPQVDLLFANPLDLGFGRRVHCAQKGSGARLTTLCWTETHGFDPGTPQFGDPQAALNAAYSRSNHRGTAAILQDKGGLRFFNFWPSDDYYGSDILSGTKGPAVTHGPVFDTEGIKQVPQSCLACHGGRLNLSTMRVEGATMLPIEPKGLVFPAGGDTRAAQEDRIRAVNSMILGSNPSAAVAAYINGMYGGAAAQAGARANDAYIPPGWTAQAGLYRDIVRPYCTTCHMSQSGDLAFTSWAAFLATKDRIQHAVCTVRSMPHAQLPYQKMWTSGSAVFLPGVLSTALGFTKCP